MTAAKVDFEHFLHGSPEQKQAAADQLVDSFRMTGFVRLVNSGIPLSAIQDAEDWSYKFFQLDAQKKAKVLNVPSRNPQRGWSYLGAESTARLKNPGYTHLTDEKEHFDVGPPDDTAYPNKWMENELSGFRQFSEYFYNLCQTLCVQIMAAMELGCGLPPGLIQDRCKPAASELRYNHYPRVSLGKLYDGLTRRGWPHTDFGIITLLFQDMQGGLQYEDRNNPGSFLPLRRESEDEVAVNISDTFQRWSNDTIPAGVHQVWLPTVAEEHLDQRDYIIPERKSNVFFFKANRNALVGALPDFVSETRPSRYENITALEFHKRMTDVLIKNALVVPDASA